MAKLTANQEQAILLLAKGETVTATAAAVGVTRQTVSEWLNLDAGADKLRGMLQKALDALQAGFDSEDLSTRERAQLGMALLKNVGLMQRASAVGSTNADDIRSSQVLSDMLNFAR
jgi:transcriptional regulator with XRE-family HTH domain